MRAFSVGLLLVGALGCSSPTVPMDQDAGDRDAGPCTSTCEACSLAYCADRCDGVHEECITNAAGDCDAIRTCIMGPTP